MSGFTPPHWSATRFMLFEQCPGAYKARYVDAQPLEPTEALNFGKAVHMALEAHYQGNDGDVAFRHAWRALAQQCYGRQLGQPYLRLLETGFELLERVYGLGLVGIPEFGFALDTELALGAPVVGAIDLWGTNHVLYDFKTTIGAWSQQRAEQELWQPLLYSWAYRERTGVLPSFEYVVCSRATGRVQRFARRWTEQAWAEQWATMYERARAISVAVQAGQFVCPEKHGCCPECGQRWSHDHQCAREDISPRIRLR